MDVSEKAFWDKSTFGVPNLWITHSLSFHPQECKYRATPARSTWKNNFSHSLHIWVQLSHSWHNCRVQQKILKNYTELLKSDKIYFCVPSMNIMDGREIFVSSEVPLQCQAPWGQSNLENTAPALGFNIFQVPNIQGSYSSCWPTCEQHKYSWEIHAAYPTELCLPYHLSIFSWTRLLPKYLTLCVSLGQILLRSVTFTSSIIEFSCLQTAGKSLHN